MLIDQALDRLLDRFDLLGQEAALNDTETGYNRQTDPTYDAGLDVKYGLSSNFTLDLTLNTDFAQVEADNRQVNLTRFPLFFPEKRRFFLERASTLLFLRFRAAEPALLQPAHRALSGPAGPHPRRGPRGRAPRARGARSAASGRFC